MSNKNSSNVIIILVLFSSFLLTFLSFIAFFTHTRIRCFFTHYNVDLALACVRLKRIIYDHIVLIHISQEEMRIFFLHTDK